MRERHALTFVFQTPNEAIEFLIRVRKTPSLKGIAGEVKGNKVKIYVMGKGANREKLIKEIKMLYKQTKEPKASYFTRRYSLSLILRLAPIKISIPVKALVDLLRLEGCKVKQEGDLLESNCSLNFIQEKAKILSEKYYDVVYFNAPASFKRLVAVLAAFYEENVEKIIAELLEKGLIKKEDGRYSLLHNYQLSLENSLKILGYKGKTSVK